MSVAVIDCSAMSRLNEYFDALSGADWLPMLDAVGAIVVSQTQARIEAGGPGPDGSRWDEWSSRYSRTRHGNQSLLRGSGDLLTSITSNATHDAVAVGSNVRYAATHQYGDAKRGIPQRQYAGISDQDADEIVNIIGDYILSMAGGSNGNL
jgi:phage virion morphogenesis protein